MSGPILRIVEQRAMTTKGWRWVAWSHRAVLRSGSVSAVVGSPVET